jgi:LemA protein
MSLLRRFFLLTVISFIALGASGCSYNTIQEMDENVGAAQSEIINQYKRRADLIPGLVKAVSGYASHEKETLTQVIEARSKATSMQLSPEMLNNPQNLQKFQQAQGELSSALSRLMVVVERYPNLKADQQFLNFQAQLEGTENRIAVARKRYIEAIRNYNVTIRKFPAVITAMIFGYEKKPQFALENQEQLEKAPEIDF